jgi:hypothetical protein
MRNLRKRSDMRNLPKRKERKSRKELHRPAVRALEVVQAGHPAQCLVADLPGRP